MRSRRGEGATRGSQRAPSVRGSREAIRRGRRPYKAQQLARQRPEGPSQAGAYFKRKRAEEEKETNQTNEIEKARRVGPSPPSTAGRGEIRTNPEQSTTNRTNSQEDRTEIQEANKQENPDMDAKVYFEELKKLITDIRGEMRGDNHRTREEIIELREELSRKESVWQEEKAAINNEVQTLREKIKEKNYTINWLLNKEESRDRRERKNNIVISGWRTPRREHLKNRVKANAGVKEARGIGRARGRDGQMLILAEMNS